MIKKDTLQGGGLCKVKMLKLILGDKIIFTIRDSRLPLLLQLLLSFLNTRDQHSSAAIILLTRLYNRLLAQPWIHTSLDTVKHNFCGFSIWAVLTKITNVFTFRFDTSSLHRTGPEGHVVMQICHSRWHRFEIFVINLQLVN